MNSKQSGLIKIIAGLLLGLVGVFGFIFGKNAKTAILRFSILVLSGLAIFSGAYLFYDGLTEQAMGQMGTYDLGKSGVQPMVYASQAAFEDGLKLSFQYQPEIRRLSFKCPDQSKSFTVYNTKIGILGVPKGEVVCGDGFKLLSYQS